MFNKASTQWAQYVIPATPTITNNDVYSLTCSNGAVATKNPSQFLQWRKTGLPDGAIAKEFDVCENGEPKKYWFIVWEEKPNL